MTPMLTAQIIVESSEQPLHLRSRQSLNDQPISSRSRWNSRKWFLDNTTPGQQLTASAVVWDIVLDDGSSLLDPAHEDLLDWLRRLVWGLHTAPGDGFDPLKPGTIGFVSTGLKRVVPWMVANAIKWPHQLTPDVLDAFLLDLPQRLASEEEDDGGMKEPVSGQSGPGEFDDEPEERLDEVATISLAAATQVIQIFYYVWRQRKALRAAGLEPMPSAPWPQARGALSLARQISRQVAGWIQPLPDEVAVAILNATMKFIDTPAQDILRLRDLCDESYNRAPGTYRTGPGVSRSARNLFQRSAAEAFVFSSEQDRSEPWHAPLHGLANDDGRSTVMLRVRSLAVHLQAACCLGLQAFTGMRVNELCGLRGGEDPLTGLPVDVEVRLTPSGLDEEFVLWGKVSKGERTPREVPWLLGLRRVGDTEWPVAVRCIALLNKLLAPYRALSGSDQLLVSLLAPVALPREKKGVGRMTAARIADGYRNFIREWVDLSQLPDESVTAIAPNDLVRWRESQGSIITTHQLRNTYCQFVMAVNPRLLPAVKRQFHHQSMMITDHGYWGVNTPQVAPLRSMSRQITSRTILGVVRGGASLSGKMGKHLMSTLDELRSLVAPLDKQNAWLQVNHWVDENAIMVHPSQHGDCIPLALKSRMECWKASGKHPIGLDLEPNYSTREPAICVGCQCYSISAANVPYWKQRYLENTVAVRLAMLREDHSPYVRVVRSRSRQAMAILRDIGFNPDELEADIAERMMAYV